VFRAVNFAVSWGLARRSLNGIQAIGVDEIHWKRGAHYLTLVYQIEDGMKRLLWTMRSRLEPLKKVAQTLRNHRELLLNWFRARGTISAGVVEGLNLKGKLTMRKSFGFRTPEALETALFHNRGALPEPEFTHEFC
jgi:transposase